MTTEAPVVAPGGDNLPQHPPQTRADSRLFCWFLIALFVLAFSFVALATVKEKSLTFDEPLHLLAGYSYLKWGDYRVNPEHPPLGKLLAALPLLVFNIKDPRPTAPEWDQIPGRPPGVPTIQVAAEMFFVKNDAERLFFYGKLPLLFLTLVLGVFVFLWAKQWFGSVAAAAALILFATNPNIVAHSTIVHTDMAFATFFFVGTYFFQRALASRGGLVNGLAACFLFGLAAVTKFSAIGIFMAWSLIGVVWIFRSEPRPGGDGIQGCTRQKKTLWLSAMLVAMTLTAFTLTWAAYGFHFAAIPRGGVHWSYADVMPPNAPPLLHRLVSFVAQLHLLPDAWIYGELYNVKYLRRTAFLMGSVSNQGFWLYFPVALLVKTPVPALLLIGLAVAGLFSSLRLDQTGRYILWLPVLVYFLLAVWARMNIGVRHILPIFPFLFVLAAESAGRLWTGRARWKKGCVIFLGLWAFWNVFAAYPNYLAFFNELAGGPKNGHKILLDSNLDWGQDLKGLKAWMDRRGIKKIILLYFGTAEPAYYGIDAVRFPGGLLSPRLSLKQTPGVPYTLAISANYFYAGRIYGTRMEKEVLQQFQFKEPDAVIDHSILVFNLDPSDPRNNIWLGMIMGLSGDWALAEESLRKVLSDLRFSAQAHEMLAQVLAWEGKSKESAYHFDQARTLPRSPEGSMGMKGFGDNGAPWVAR
jgi:hypothetical protein